MWFTSCLGSPQRHVRLRKPRGWEGTGREGKPPHLLPTTCCPPSGVLSFTYIVSCNAHTALGRLGLASHFTGRGPRVSRVVGPVCPLPGRPALSVLCPAGLGVAEKFSVGCNRFGRQGPRVELSGRRPLSVQVRAGESRWGWARVCKRSGKMAESHLCHLWKRSVPPAVQPLPVGSLLGAGRPGEARPGSLRLTRRLCTVRGA